MKRIDGRKADQIRSVTIVRHYLKYPAGSVLIEMGNTRVLCVASIEEKVPRWLKEGGETGGWITAEYSMLPAASGQRKPRESTAGKVGGRTHEIQRLIGRSLRAVVDLDKLGQRTIWVDCDVLQADGGTRTAAVTGGFVALHLAVEKMLTEKKIAENPILEPVAAVSVGILDKTVLLDLCYEEDVKADVDMNVVMTKSGRFVEVQGMAESKPFSDAQLKTMLRLAKKGIGQLMEMQDKS